MEKRFERIYVQNSITKSIEVLLDKSTGVQYLFCQSGYSGGAGLTPLLDSEGKPIIHIPEDLE